MNQISQRKPYLNPSRFLHYVWLALFSILSACGGSGSAPGSVDGKPVTGNTSSGAPSLGISLVSIDGKVKESGAAITLEAPLTVQATLKDGAGAPLANSIVQFSTGGGLVSIEPASGSVLTNASGVASVKLVIRDAVVASSQVGAAGTINALAVVGDKTASANSKFQIGASGTTPNAAGSLRISVNLQDAQGNTSRISSLESPLTAFATVLDDAQKPVANAIVNFSANASLSTITPASGTVLTDSKGVASIKLQPKDLQTAQSQSGAADTLVATSTLNGKAFSAQAVYQTGATVASTASASLNLALVNASGQTANSVTPSSPITAKATLLDAKGAPIANTLVTFATSGVYTILSPASGATLTNAQGIASITIVPKDLNTALAQSGTADSIKATATVGSNPLLSSANFQLGTAGVTLALVAPSSGSLNLNAYDTTLLKVDVLVNGTLYTADPININFSSGCTSNGRASMPASATTVNGRAQIVYTDKGCGGTDIVTAAFAGAPSVTASLIVSAPVAASLGFVSATPSDQAIVIKGAGGVGRSETATLTFIALDTAGKPLQNQLVNFSVNSTQTVTLQASSATTDSNGRAVATVNSGTLPTTFRVIAAFADKPTISTVSSVVTVSNGAATQTAFSLSQILGNIEGWEVDNTSNTVAILLADASGNPVVDGTPVVFQTDSGAIGSASNGGCVTVNGACTVNFRSQNPRTLVSTTTKRAGLAIITASSTTALVNISGQIAMFMSGSYARNVFPYLGSTPYLTTNNTLSTSSCGTYSLVIEVNDVNLNPMPFGTKITVLNPSADISIGTIVPLTVPNIAPRDNQELSTLDVSKMAVRQGSRHTIPVTLPASCVANGTVTKAATFTLSIISPAGGEALYPFTLEYGTGAPPP